MRVNGRYFSFILVKIIVIGSIFLSSCGSEESGLAPYAGSPEMSSVKIESGTFQPKITWIGGYASVLGVNKGEKAALDTSIIWLIKIDGNNLRYPIKFGSIPDGASDITLQYGGASVDSLSEDVVYTFWVMKESMWENVSGIIGAELIPKSDLDENEFIQSSDTTVELSSFSYTKGTEQLDVYVNISNVRFFGRLGEIYVSQPVDATGPTISWRISQSGVTDTLISAIGIVNGQQFDERYIFWDLWSVEESNGEKVYGKKNVIKAPIKIGDHPEGTITFNELPEKGLERNKDYYIWIATENWEGNRSRVANFYAYATFRTW